MIVRMGRHAAETSEGTSRWLQVLVLLLTISLLTSTAYAGSTGDDDGRIGSQETTESGEGDGEEVSTDSTVADDDEEVSTDTAVAADDEDVEEETTTDGDVEEAESAAGDTDDDEASGDGSGNAQVSEQSTLILELAPGLSSSEQVDVIVRNGGTEKSVIAPLRLHTVAVPADGVDEAVAAYEADPDVISVEVDRIRAAESTPSDPSYGEQWALTRIGWDLAYGSVTPEGSALIAVVDTGVDAAHPDLAGVVDSGWSAFGTDPNVDPNGHGTALAGVAAAVTDNGEGISGVAFAGAEVTSVQALDAEGVGWDSDVVAGIVWAADHGADVILLGFSNEGASAALQAAADYAWSKGAVVVAAVGNDGSNTVTFPAGARGVMGVSATDGDDLLTSSSNRGDAVFIGAPGIGITAPTPGGGYITTGGTSVSAAIVAGLAALVKADDPGASNGVIVGRLARTADEAGDVSHTGNGRLNLARALEDTSTEAVQPAAAPGGGPFVGPYVIAANNFVVDPQSTSVEAGATHDFTWTFTATNAGNVSASTFTIPDGWTPPQTGSGPGQLSVSGCVEEVTISEMTVTISQSGSAGNGSCGNGDELVVTYDQATAPIPASPPQVDNFIFQHGDDPSVTVTAPTVEDTSVTGVSGSGTYGESGELTAILGSNAEPLEGEPISFQLDGDPVGTATTNESGVATLAGASLDGFDAGTYAGAVTATFSGSPGYAPSSGSGDLTVDQRAIEVTADDQSKVYGEDDPDLVYSVTSGSLVDGDSLIGEPAREPGEDVGSYAIQQGTVTASGNYDLTFEEGTFTIGTRAITVTAQDQSKGYGDTDPELTYQVTGTLVDGDDFSGQLSRDTGEDVGTYAITQGDLSLSGNYALTFVPGELEIIPRSITVTSDNQGKFYGEDDPELTYEITSGTLVDGDEFSGELVRESGEDVGTYAITQGDLSLSGNYALTFVPGELEIIARSITLTADDQSKVYGEDDPQMTWEITSGSLVFGDTVSGSLTRPTGEDVGIYSITQGSLALSSNYDLTFVAGQLSITQRPIEVTADAKSKVYGELDPNLTYSITSGSLATGDDLTGELTRAPGENVGTYTIQQGTLEASPNYDLSFVGADLTIAVRTIEVTADAKSKTYGETDPALTYEVTQGSLASGDSFSGALARAGGEDVGTYSILQGDLDVSSNYSISYVGADLTISERPVTVTADDKSKVYGEAEPPLTWQITSGSLALDDEFTGSLDREAGEDVGTYAITQGSLALDANYDLTFVGADLTITRRPVEVTADAKAKVYGEDDPALTYQITGGSLAFSDAFSGSLIREPGEDVGTYAIEQGTVMLSDNYDLTYVGADLTVTARPLTVSADDQSKVYGEDDPELNYSIMSGSLAFDDEFTGSLEREPGENVGTFAIQQGTLALSNNYALTFVDGALTVTVRPVTVTADDRSKVYGDADPELTYQITSGSLAFDDDLSGALARAPGEQVASYAITQGSLALSDNYDLTFVSGTLTITRRAVEVTADPQTKVYGDADPGLIYKISDGSLAFDDTFAGSLTRQVGEDVGSYAIEQGTLALSDNYDLTYVGAELTITKRPVEVTADGKSKTYGEADPAWTYQISDGSLAFDDQFSGELTRVSGEDVGTYAIQQGTLGLSDNYDLTYVGADLTIMQRSVTVTADDQSKVYGDPDPAFTYQITDGSLAFDDEFAGALAREPGEDVGTYTILQGTLGLSDNYQLTFVSGELEINTREVTASFTAAEKVWDGTTDATIITRSLGNTVSGDDVELTGGSAHFEQALVGENLTVTATGFTLSGEDAANYHLEDGPWTTQASITPAFRFDGFYRPVEMSPSASDRTYNTVKGGRTVPLKFQVYSTTGDQEEITELSYIQSVRYTGVACDSGNVVQDEIEAESTANKGLFYAGEFHFNWSVPKAPGKCYEVTVVTIDGNELRNAFFRSK